MIHGPRMEGLTASAVVCLWTKEAGDQHCLTLARIYLVIFSFLYVPCTYVS